MHDQIAAVLFDMGGVLVRLDSLDNVFGPSRLSSDEMWDHWLTSDAVRRHESGACSVEEFAAQLHDELALEGTPSEFVERFRRFPMGLYDGAVELVESVRHVTAAVLSNTSALHWDHQRDADVLMELFDRRYLSYELGMLKPDRAIFEFVIADLQLPPDQLLFIDDNQINVDGARAAGLHAGLAKGPHEAAVVLRSFGVLGAA